MTIINEVEHDRFLAEAYDLMFAERIVWEELHPDDVVPFGETPSEKLKTLNWASWCEQAKGSARFCRLCQWPLDTPQETMPDSCCQVCKELEYILFQRPYWQNIKNGQGAEARNWIGLG